MDLHAVPFPTTHQTEDVRTASSASYSHALLTPDGAYSRLSSTKGLPPLPASIPLRHSLTSCEYARSMRRFPTVNASFRVPHHYKSLPTVLPLQGPARHRPHLRPLDLASSPSSSPTRRDGHTASRRAPSLLTPPLTPSSSFNSTSNDTPATPPDSHSPLRWVSSSERDRVFSAAHSAYTAGLKSHMSASSATAAHNAGYLTPTSARSQSLSSDDGSGVVSVPSTASDISSVASGLASVEITPRDERTFVLDGQDDIPSDLVIEESSCEKSTRLLLVSLLTARAHAHIVTVLGPNY